jgi:hypothetical protein
LKARLRQLTFNGEKGTLHVVFEATAIDRLASGDRMSAKDNRLTLYDTFRYSRRWGLIAVAAAWLASTSWAVFGAWKQLRG